MGGWAFALFANTSYRCKTVCALRLSYVYRNTVLVMSQTEGLSSFMTSLMASLDDPNRATPPQEPEAPKKKKVMWKFGKPVFPLIIVKKRPMEHEEELKELHCGCKCAECISNYKAYWVEKIYSQEIKAAMDSEKEVRKEIFAEIAMMEENYKRQLNDVQVSLAVSEDKCRKLSEAIELERSLRMDDVYRREVTSEEMKAATLQRVAAEETVFRKDEEIIRLRAEAEGLREAARAALAIKDKALSQLRSYEMQINSVDRDNSEFRVRLHASEVEAAKLRHKNDQLKAKLESIRPHEIHQAKEARAKSAADRALASLSAAGPGAAAGAGGAGRARHQVALLAASSSFISREGSSSLSASTLAQALALPGVPLSLASHQHQHQQQQQYHHHRGPAARGLSEQPSLSALSSITGISGHW